MSILENVSPERSREDLRNMRDVLVKEKYHRLREKHDLSEKEVLNAAYLLS